MILPIINHKIIESMNHALMYSPFVLPLPNQHIVTSPIMKIVVSKRNNFLVIILGFMSSIFVIILAILHESNKVSLLNLSIPPSQLHLCCNPTFFLLSGVQHILTASAIAIL